MGSFSSQLNTNSHFYSWTSHKCFSFEVIPPIRLKSLSFRNFETSVSPNKISSSRISHLGSVVHVMGHLQQYVRVKVRGGV